MKAPKKKIYRKDQDRKSLSNIEKIKRSDYVATDHKKMTT